MKITIINSRTLDIKYCCKEMEEAWEVKAVFFGDIERECYMPTHDINIRGPWYSEFPIKFCPFCASKIEKSL